MDVATAFVVQASSLQSGGQDARTPGICMAASFF